MELEKVKNFIEKRPFLIHAFLYFIGAVSIYLLWSANEAQDDDLATTQTRVISIEAADPCNQVPLPKKACQIELQNTVDSLSPKQSCEIIEKAGYVCRIVKKKNNNNPNEFERNRQNRGQNTGALPDGIAGPPLPSPTSPSGGGTENDLGGTGGGGDNNPPPTNNPPPSGGGGNLLDPILDPVEDILNNTQKNLCKVNPLLCLN